MINHALIYGGLLAVSLGGWRIMHSEAPKVEWSEDLISHDYEQYRAMESNWTARSHWNKGVIEFRDETEENPEAEDYRDRNWIGCYIEMRARPYWAKQIWPRTWRFVSFEFSAPRATRTWRLGRDGEYVPTGALPYLHAVVTISAGEESLEFELGRSRDIRVSGIGWYSDVALRENEARQFFDFMRHLDAGTTVKMDVVYYDNPHNLESRMWEIATHSISFTAPPESIWAAFPEMTYWPWQENRS